MLDIFSLLGNLLGSIFTFLNDFKVIGDLSLFTIFVILFLFSVALKFLFNKNDKD